jgi:mannosyltransferase OCH1-like enzyme
LTLRDVCDHAATIMDDEFRHYYFREIALRANLAAASDILRLHVIYQFGGVYVDCDTLPSLDHVFAKTGAYCRRNKV